MNNRTECYPMVYTVLAKPHNGLNHTGETLQHSLRDFRFETTEQTQTHADIHRHRSPQNTSAKQTYGGYQVAIVRIPLRM